MDHSAPTATTRAAYDATAETYARLVGTELSAHTEGPLDLAMLDDFVEAVGDDPAHLVADIGCGPARVAAFLARRGIDVVGVDLSGAMLEVASSAHSDLRLVQGHVASLPIAGGSLAGVVCWYSIIHTPPEHLDRVSTELARVLAPHGHALLAFQAGNGASVQREEVYGAKVSLTSFRHAPDSVAARLVDAGLRVDSQAIREAELPHETSPQAFIVATRA